MGGMRFVMTVGGVGRKTVKLRMNGQRIVPAAADAIQLHPDICRNLAKHIEPSLAAEGFEKVAHAQTHVGQLLELLHPGPSGEGIVDDPPDACLEKS